MSLMVLGFLCQRMGRISSVCQCSSELLVSSAIEAATHQGGRRLVQAQTTTIFGLDGWCAVQISECLHIRSGALWPRMPKAAFVMCPATANIAGSSPRMYSIRRVSLRQSHISRTFRQKTMEATCTRACSLCYSPIAVPARIMLRATKAVRQYNCACQRTKPKFRSDIDALTCRPS